MILGHEDIEHYIKTHKLEINNINETTIRENGLDCKIGGEIAIDIHVPKLIIDTHDKSSIDSRFKFIKFEDYIIIPPKTNILLVTDEEFKIPDDIMAFCASRSTIARQGFIIPITIVDAGFEGTLTIEAFYGGNNPIKLYKGDRFLHVIFAKINSPVLSPYKGIYSGQTGIRLPKVMD